ncbi:fluoride efflux transporter CrcB [Pseudohongiella spirulinae]|uniref:Fluoride-specific ion channel FluC n=1 Tax=Pseudohongiella spirulinae TaxID=1249552 RepID=A0A0S2KD19_9GAMM|nr:fluoride efflux transporter CrcB [Pseudohongiella spirulinae]ALO46208.1 Putative fluoride ion transporter CrcB [Pseudohongiella spirulinae]
MMWLFIALGGAAGALARYSLMTLVHASRIGTNGAWQLLPIGTLIVNVLGSLLIGMLYVLIIEKMILPAEFRSLLVVGLLGAFTTFSTFSLDTVLLLEQGFWLQAITYTLLSVVLCVLAAWLGMAILRLVA